MRKFSFHFLMVMSLLQSCSKSKGTDTGAGAPTNLQVSGIVNPDSSGNVLFTATATNASTFEYNFGNGSVQVVPSGISTYKYLSSGSYNVTVTAKSSTGQTVSKTIPIEITLPLKLVWSDEFDKDGAPDASKWGYDIGGNGWGNAELEYYTDRRENSVVENGLLKIKAKKEGYMGSGYTSARLLTKDKLDFTFGKVEVRAKLPSGVGTWPAIWMLGSNINTVPWPGCGEMDIMEHLGRDLNKIYGTFHYPGRFGGNADGKSILISNATTEFHVYKIDWRPNEIKIYADEQLVHSIVNSSSVPFNHTFFIILNLAIGGNFAGSVDPALTNATMEVDYVRLYK